MSKRVQQPTTVKPEPAVTGINPAVDVAQSLQRGEPPSTADVAQVLQKSERSLDEKLVSAQDEQTRTIVRDTQAAMGATREFIESKNVGEKLQSIYRETTLAAQAGTNFPEAIGLNEEDKRILTEMRARMLETSVIGRDLLRLIIMNPAFRESLTNMMTLAYDMFYNVGEAVVEEQPPVESDQPASKRAKKAAAAAEKAIKGKRTESQRRELAERLKKLLQQLRDNELYQRGVNNLFRLADLVKIGAEKAGEKVEKMEVEFQAEPHTKKALEETKALAEEFLPGERTLDPLLEKLKQLILAVRDDNKLADHMKKWRNYVEEAMKNPGKITSDEFIKRGDQLADEAVNLQISSKLSEASKSAYNEWKDVFTSFKEDEQLNMLNVTFKKLMSDITKRDELGRTTLDLQALARFRPIVVELLKRNLEKIPLPDIKGEDETYQWKAWNLIASGSEILPDYISVDTSTRSQTAIKDVNRPSWLQGDLIISVSNIRTKMENVEFWYNRKTFPSGEETGVMDIDVAGGINVVIKLVLEASDKEGGLMFTSGSVYCRADDVRVKVRETKHDILYNMFSGYWAQPIKENIEKFISEKLAGAIREFREAANERVREIQKEGIAAVMPEALKSQITA